MTTINTHIEQAGGWFSVSVGLTSELAYCPAYITNANANKIVINSVYNNVEILPIGENITISETPALSKEGKFYNINAVFEIAGQSTALDNFLNSYLGRHVFLIGVKHHGQQKIYGSKTFPLDFKYNYINGKNYEDGSRVRITVTGKIPQKPVFIND